MNFTVYYLGGPMDLTKQVFAHAPAPVLHVGVRESFRHRPPAGTLPKSPVEDVKILASHYARRGPLQYQPDAFVYEYVGDAYE